MDFLAFQGSELIGSETSVWLDLLSWSLPLLVVGIIISVAAGMSLFILRESSDEDS